ncbi:response regulator transcription factor [Paenibacillus hexagrammi]|uniref:Response regulator transcription factor n=1 Tax=Paenibacillus hexagrammi TaxID=2908839 RepID=A0ABY3SKG9_9BACL|nr:response regulator transcription factor [Paenibacillus sp. YPD9-1]UJF33973.1 response regulator transcription factor [Paenibacillus sp. YPD9-1]
MSTKIRIVIADDQTLLRDALQTIINLEPDMEVVGVAENGEQATELVRRHQPDLVLMDVRMPQLDGIAATKIIMREFPDTMIVVLTTFAEDEYIVESMAHGAKGFLLKDMPGEKIIQALRDVYQGQLMMPSIIASKLAARISFLTSGPQKPLTLDRTKLQGITFTEREKHIIQLMLDGKSNKEMAKTLYMSEGTVKNYVSIIYHKIGVKDRTKAILCLKEMFS